MNNLLIIFLAISVGATGFRLLDRNSAQTQTQTDAVDKACQIKAREAIKAENLAAFLRAEVKDKKNRLYQAMRHPNVSPGLFRLLEGHFNNDNLGDWAELRQELAIGWDVSPDYVLVRKQVLKKLEYPHLTSNAGISDKTADLLALSPVEQTAIREIILHVQEAGKATILRGQPSGDTVAQYTEMPLDASIEMSVSNNFNSGVIAAIGSERAEIFLSQAWRELSSSLAPSEPETITIRKTIIDGEPDLICETKDGDRVAGTLPVRYAHYPTGWFMSLFPGGWQTVAQREDFDLPKRFMESN